MAKFKVCPRCELNWIKEEEELCDVCKAQLANEDDMFQDEEEEICPMCKTNYVEPGEKYCTECQEKRRKMGLVETDVEMIVRDADEEDRIVSLEETLEEGNDISDQPFDEDIDSFDDDFTGTDIEDEDFIPDLEEEEEEEDEEMLEEKNDDELERDFSTNINPLDFEQDDEEDEMEIRRQKLKNLKDED